MIWKHHHRLDVERVALLDGAKSGAQVFDMGREQWIVVTLGQIYREEINCAGEVEAGVGSHGGVAGIASQPTGSEPEL